MRVFIGSSSEAIEKARHLAAVIERIGHEPKLWENEFEVSKFNFECLERIALEVDTALFIFTEDDKIYYRKHEFPTARDNVLIEFGLFCGFLERSNVAFGVSGKPKIPNDLEGLTYINLNSEYTANENIKNWLEKCHNRNVDLNAIKDVFLFQNNKCLVTLPTIVKHNGPNEKVLYHRCQDAPLQWNILNLISKVKGIESSIIRNTHVHYGTEVHIGSVGVSSHVNYYVGRALPDFEWHISDETFDIYFDKEIFNTFSRPELKKANSDWQGCKLLNMEYEYKHLKRDVAFVLRLCNENFLSEQPKTVHVLFGCGEGGRKGAVEYFTKNYSIISKKWGTNDYLLIARVDSNGMPLDKDAFSINYLQ